MCCRCCTSLKVAAIWGSSIQMALGTILLLQFFILPEDLGEYYNFYLVYISLLVPLGALIFLAVFKEMAFLVKLSATSLILLQLFGLSLRLLLPLDMSDTFRMLRRIVFLFVAILLTAVYSAILLLFHRKLAKAAREAKLAAEEAAMEAAQRELDEEDLEAGGRGRCDGDEGRGRNSSAVAATAL